jgi:hypothetical protein
MLSSSDTDGEIHRALRSGAAGYIHVEHIVEKFGANDRARRDHRGPSWIAEALVAPSNLQKSMAPKLVRPMAAPTRAWTIFLRHVR